MSENQNNVDPPRYAYSINEEDYHGDYASREDAIDGCMQEEDMEGQTEIWTGVKYQPKRSIDVDEVINTVAGNATEGTGEYSEDYLCDIPKEAVQELEDELNKVWAAWEKKHNLEPTWFCVCDVECHTVEPIESNDRD